MTSRNSAVAEPQQVIMRAHQRMRAAKGNFHAERGLGIGDAGSEVIGRDGDVVELQHS